MFVIRWRKFGFVALSIVLQVLLLVSMAVASIDISTSLQSCRDAGFDPYQLSCSTCDLLPESMVETCQSCCLSYKTLEKRTRRYPAAVVTHAIRMPHYFPEMNNMVNEDWKDLIQQKGENRLVLRDISDKPQAPAILWFDKLPRNVDSMPLNELERLAVETVHLVGWKRDDIREMIKAIILDR